LGLPPLDFDLDEHSRGKIMRASILPAAALVAQIMTMLLEFEYSSYELLGFEGVHDAPDVWQRVYQLAWDVRFIQYVSLASLFGAGLYRWTRSEGTWSLVIGMILAAVALVIFCGVASIQFVTQDSVVTFEGLTSWLSLSATCGLLAIGYFFLAYRGLASPTPRRRQRRAIRRQPPPSVVSLDE
jgi:hypothetical protein